MFCFREIAYVLKCSSIFILLLVCNSVKSQPKKVNLITDFKTVGIPALNFEDEPMVSLKGHNYKLAAVSGDLKHMAVSRSYIRKGDQIMDVVLIKLKNLKESVIIDTQMMIRYGRPNGYLYQLEFNDDNMLVAYIGDGFEGTTVLTIDPEKNKIIKDEYHEEYYGEDGEDFFEGEIRYEEKIKDLMRIFPSKPKMLLPELAYKLISVDTVGYLTQGILSNDNSIFYLPHSTGKLRLIHNLSDGSQKDNINGLWGSHDKVFYFLKDKKYDYFFRYDIKSNAVTLLDKYPVHCHFNIIENFPLSNGDKLLYFEVENSPSSINESLKLFRYSNGNLYKIENYPHLQQIGNLPEQSLFLFYYVEDGKQCIDLRIIN